LEAAERATPAPRPEAVAPQRNQGHGQRLTAAFEALEEFPALAEPRNRLLRLVRDAHASTGDVIAAVESDVALAISVLRLANHAGPRAGQIGSIPAAVEILGPTGVETLTMRTAVFDFFERTAAWDTAPERFRLHAVATQRATERVAREVGWDDRDPLLVAALLHDVGKLVLMHAYPGYPDKVHAGARTPEERILRERRELGVDHAVVGGVLARRWGLPQSLSRAIERHHSDDAQGAAAIIRMADMLAHHAQERAVDPGRLLNVARSIGLDPAALRAIMYELPYGAASGRRRAEPCPLSGREVQILKKLAEGNVYKQIAAELGLSTSTVRTHLHNIYGKMNAVDRAQAVLMATEKGWL
jgi:putative nucleotidyltransferase with HDIG domain